MAQQIYLAIDLGAESGRVVAGLFDGKTVQLEELHRFRNGPVSVGGTLRWDLVNLWREIQIGIAKGSAQFGDSIQSIGVDTWGVDYVLMTDKEELLGLPYCYRDDRTNGLMNHTLTQVSRDEIFSHTGLQFMEINTLYQLVAMSQQSPKLLSQAATFLMIPDFLNWLLCGSRVVEFTNATTTQCFHAANRTWAFDMLGKLGLPGAMFPNVVDPGTKLGTLREEVAREANCARFDVVAPATHDTGSAVVAVPTELTGTAKWAYISSGTWSLMGLEVPEAVLTERALALNVTNEGGVDGTFRLLKNIMGLWLVQQCRTSFERKGNRLEYAELAALAAEAEPFRSLVEPDDERFLAPDDMAEAIASWCRDTDQPEPETPGQFIRCCLESLALKYRRVLGWLEELGGDKVEVVHIVGGGTKNELLNQFTSNACGCPVVTGPVEATALGNVLIQARTAGQIGSLAEIRKVVRNSSEMNRYEPTDMEQWDAADARLAEFAGRLES
ncbi:MAG: rhamnulokinase [Planctomycetota bacterium]|nr:rhamnulokinase [Planctomycetota bacterium]MDA1249938.1 rhamnulokinase [Planctomycetota bacterium]